MNSMRHDHLLIKLGVLLGIIVASLWALSTHAATGNYVPLVGIPGISSGPNTSLVGYLNALYMLAIALGGMFAVVKIAVAGTKYALSDVVTSKEDAKKDIQGVLLGLAILVVPYIVLVTINPNLVSLDILRNAQSIQQTPPPSGASSLSVGSEAVVPKNATIAERGAFIQQQEKSCTGSGGIPNTYTSGGEVKVSCFPKSSSQSATGNQALLSGGTATYNPTTYAEEQGYWLQANQICGQGNVTRTISGTLTQKTRAITLTCKVNPQSTAN